VLDEVEFLSDKDRNREILYFLSRSSVRYMAVALEQSALGCVPNAASGIIFVLVWLSVIQRARFEAGI
jgi:hypothetical protein